MGELATEPTPLVLQEVMSGDGLSFSAAGRLFPGHRGGKAMDSSAIYRWYAKGKTGPSGALVRLEACRVGSRWLTSKQSLNRFIMRLTGTVPASALTERRPTRSARRARARGWRRQSQN